MACNIRGKKTKAVLLLVLAAFLSAACWAKLWRGPAATAAAPVYHGSAREKKIALTFNVVWGEEYIPQILESLNEYSVPATFFIGGQWAESFPGLVRDIAGAGHELGSHGYSHPHPDRISLQANIEEIRKTEEILIRIAGKKPDLFAPPYGERGEAVLRAAEEAGYTTILWSIDTIDWQRPEPGVIVRRVTAKACNGAIVLMHPTAPTAQALPQIIRELKGQGYELVKVSTLLEGMKKEKKGAAAGE
ncbi:MAG: polysaccharide deacetylase family protein [Peptococcaceae bacterium]|nr:polysaccharide deacetylase family protein [Peptococcaceae bacterium]